MTKETLLEKLDAHEAKSTWEKGVVEYAHEIISAADGKRVNNAVNPNELERALLNGARDWLHYCDGCCALVYTYDILERLLTPDELEHYADEWTTMHEFDDHAWNWQQRAVQQAWRLIRWYWTAPYIAMI